MQRWQLALAVLIIVLVLISTFFLLFRSKFDDYLFYPRWTLRELEANFVGAFPRSAINIEYKSAPAYALLKFDATPSDVSEFINRFCNGFGYSGYDPFNATDSNEEADEGNLIQSDHNRYYHSFTENISDDIWGNRCSQSVDGGLVQIRVDKTNQELHEVWVEIGGGCHSDISPTPCSGNRIDYVGNEELIIGEEQIITPRHASGEMWNLQVQPSENYTLSIHSDEATSSNGVSVRILPVFTENTQEPYCASCWVDERGIKIEDSYQVSFLGSPSSVSQIRLFWFGDSDFEYKIIVEET